MAATNTSGMKNKPKENIDKTTADSSGCGSGNKQMVMAPNKSVQPTSNALHQMPPTALMDKPTIGVDSTKDTPTVNDISLHPNSAVKSMAMAELKDPPGDRAAALSAEDTPDSQG